MKKTTKQKESQVQLFELFSVEELESRLEFKRKGRKPHGISGVGARFNFGPCALADILFGG